MTGVQTCALPISVAVDGATMSAAGTSSISSSPANTDTQYAFSRAVAGHMFSNYDSVLKIDGEVGNKKMYDPRSWGREAESAMAARVVEACRQLGSAGKALK